MFTLYLHLHLRLWSCEVEAFMQRSKPSYQVRLLLSVMMILDIKIWNPWRFVSRHSTPKIDIKYPFFLHAILERLISLIYFGNQQRHQKHQMHKIISLRFCFFYFEVEKTSNRKRKIVNLWYQPMKMFPKISKIFSVTNLKSSEIAWKYIFLFR